MSANIYLFANNGCRTYVVIIIREKCRQFRLPLLFIGQFVLSSRRGGDRVKRVGGGDRVKRVGGGNRYFSPLQVYFIREQVNLV